VLINHHYALRKNPEQRSSQESEKSLKEKKKRIQQGEGENKDSVERKKNSVTSGTCSCDHAAVF